MKVKVKEIVRLAGSRERGGIIETLLLVFARFQPPVFFIFSPQSKEMNCAKVMCRHVKYKEK